MLVTIVIMTTPAIKKNVLNAWMFTFEVGGLLEMLMTFEAVAVVGCGVRTVGVAVEFGVVGPGLGVELEVAVCAASLCASCAPCSFSRRFKRI